MFQATAFQTNAFQISRPANDNPSNAGDYVTPYDRYKEEEYQKRINREKSEVQKIDSVIDENKRKAELAAKNRLLAAERRAAQLAILEQEYLNEINRLLVVRAELMRRIKEDEAILIILMVMKKRRLRAA